MMAILSRAKLINLQTVIVSCHLCNDLTQTLLFYFVVSLNVFYLWCVFGSVTPALLIFLLQIWPSRIREVSADSPRTSTGLTQVSWAEQTLLLCASQHWLQPKRLRKPVSKRPGYASRRINVPSPLESTADPPVWRLAESLRHFTTLKTFKRVRDIQDR